VFWSRHQSCTFHSSFDLLQFPFDEQTLAVRRTSFSYTDRELLLKLATPTGWRPAPETDFTNSLWDYEYAFSNTSALAFINTHSVNAYIGVGRKSTSYIVKMILPMALLVLLSSLSYAVDPGSPPARVGFSVSLVLSIVTFNLVVSQDLPKVRSDSAHASGRQHCVELSHRLLSATGICLCSRVSCAVSRSTTPRCWTGTCGAASCSS
jgi:hypothetical protein